MAVYTHTHRLETVDGQLTQRPQRNIQRNVRKSKLHVVVEDKGRKFLERGHGQSHLMMLKRRVIEGLEVSISLSNQKITGESGFLVVVGGVGRDKTVVGGEVGVNDKLWEML